MSTLYLDCGMGAAGDMLGAALYELLDEDERAAALRDLNALGIPHVRFDAEPAATCGVAGTRFHVYVDGAEETPSDGGSAPAHEQGHEHADAHDGHGHAHDHGHHHAHHGLADIERVIADLPLPPQVAANAAAVFGHIAEAESAVHGAPIDQIHFHEVGTFDAVADVVAASYLFHRIGASRVVASPVNVGSGTVRCAHGVLPVPAPATALILRGVPTYAGAVKSELCTPTGAALLAHFASAFEAQPLMAVERIGYGIGTKEFAQANCVRALLGEEAGAGGTAGGDEAIVELSCNIDDDTPEHIAFALELLLDEGALDAFTVPLTMKKSRPGVLLCAICKPEDRDRLARLILRHTSTLGVRWKACGRLALAREAGTAPTPWGPVQVKRSSGYGVTRVKVEHDSAAALARAHDLTLKDIEAFL